MDLDTLRLRAVNMLGLTSALDMPGGTARVDEALNNVWEREYPNAMGDNSFRNIAIAVSLTGDLFGDTFQSFLVTDQVANIDAAFWEDNEIRVYRDGPQFWEKWDVTKLTQATAPRGTPEDVFINVRGEDVLNWRVMPVPVSDGTLRFFGRSYPNAPLATGGIEESSSAKIVYTGAAMELAGELGMSEEIQAFGVLWGRLIALRGQKDKMANQEQIVTLSSEF